MKRAARSVPASARPIALDVLRRVERGGAFASLLLQRLPAATPPREVALATELVYGTLRWRYHDEAILEALSGRALAEIDPDLALLFRIAAHQILRLDRIPERAAVHEAVEAAKSLPSGRGEAGARFLNAVLRRLVREKGSLPLPPLPEAGAPIDDARLAWVLSVHFSHPEWIVRRWIGRYGATGARALLEADNRPAPLSVRVDTARAGFGEAAASMAEEGVTTVPSSITPGFLRVTEGSPVRSRAFRLGWIYVQDEASGLIPFLVDARKGDRVLDACAAPGGKTLELARLCGASGMVVAGDLHPARLGLVRSNARRMQIENVRLVAGDFAAPPLRASFDQVLVDAPCSGSGVFRRDVESRYRLQPEDLARLAGRQAAILRGAATLVRPGGALIYSVCSLEPEEGRDQVAAFLAGHPSFTHLDARERMSCDRGLIDPGGDLVTLPHLHDIDGFYAAAMIREG